MIDQLPELLLSFFVVACRVSGAFILLPAFSSQRFPVTIRVMVSLSASLALMAYLRPYLTSVKADMPTDALLVMLFSELLVGLLFGFWGSLFLHATRFAGTFIANAIGLAGIPGQPLDDSDPNGPVANLLALAVTAMIFAFDLHLLSIRALAASYENFPLGEIPQMSWVSSRSLAHIHDVFLLALQICSPFVVYSVVINLAVGFTARFTPQLQLYFATTGLTTLIGLLLLIVASPQSASLVVSTYGQWLESGFQ